jgi:hypothetical protein
MIVKSYIQDGCEVEIWADAHPENPNEWTSGDAVFVCSSSGRGSGLVVDDVEGRGMGVTCLEDVYDFLPWSSEVPERPPDEPPNGADTDEWLADWEAWEAWESRVDNYRPGYRVFSVRVYVQSYVSLAWEGEFTGEEEPSSNRGYIIIQEAAYVAGPSPMEEFITEAGLRPPPHEFVVKVAKGHMETMERYLSGSVHGFTVKMPSGEEESCGGFYCDADGDDIKSEIQELTDAWVAKKKEMDQALTRKQLLHLLLHYTMEEIQQKEGPEGKSLLLDRLAQYRNESVPDWAAREQVFLESFPSPEEE